MNQRDQSTVVFPTRVGVNREAISAGRIAAEYSRRKGEYVCHMTVRDGLGCNCSDLMRRTGFTPTVLYLGQWPLQVEEPTDLTKSEQLR